MRIYCDCCGQDAGRCAFDVRVNLLHNPVPQDHFTIFSDPTISSDPKRMRFTLCEKCYRAMGFPNIYEAEAENRLKFRLERPKAVEAEAPKETRRWKKDWATSDTSRVCPWCGITQTVTVNPYRNKVTFAYCPYCGKPVSDGGDDDGRA